MASLSEFDSFDEDSCSGSELELSSVGVEGPQPTDSGTPSAQDASVTNALPSRSARGSRLTQSAGPSTSRSSVVHARDSDTPRRPLVSSQSRSVPAQLPSNDILNELKKVTSCLETFSERLDSLDGRLKTMEDMQTNLMSSSTEDSAHKTKRKVPARVSQTLREVYKTLQEDDENFCGFDTKKKFSDQHNLDVVTRLVSETSKLDSRVPLLQLRDAARRFYHSILETNALKDKGKYDFKVTQQRRKNRISRKLESRKSALMTSTVTSPAQKDGLKKVMLAAFMSSEESGEESIDGETEKRSVLLVKPLPWRSPRLARIFKQLDRKASRKKSKQSLQQTRPRVVGPESTRPKPLGFTYDFFGFSDK